jgi:hypothetical protein
MPTTTPGLVSTIIPVRNRPALLAEAVRSVLAQTYRPIEILIVDDSTDATVAVARGFAETHPGEVIVLAQDGRGIGAARNIGVQAAAGEFVQFLDSDDLLMPDKFARQVAALQADPGSGIAYCATREYAIGEPWSGRPSRRTGVALPALFPALLRGRVWPAPSPLYRRDVVDAIGPFSHHSLYEDWEFESRAGALRVRLQYCSAFLADKRDAHALEGRGKGGVPLRQAGEYADVLLKVHANARRAGVDAAEFEPFARRLFVAARWCAAAGDEAAARRSAGVAVRDARGMLRARITAYQAMSNLLGWPLVGRASGRVAAAAIAFRRARRWPASAYRRWRHRAMAARAIVDGAAIRDWPRLLRHGWRHRRSRRKP